MSGSIANYLFHIDSCGQLTAHNTVRVELNLTQLALKQSCLGNKNKCIIFCIKEKCLWSQTFDNDCTVLHRDGVILPLCPEVDNIRVTA